MNNNMKMSVFSLILITVCVLTAKAQIYPIRGKLNAWTQGSVSRIGILEREQDPTQFVKLKVGKNKGFDRVVFEFKNNNLPSFHLEYAKPPFEMQDGPALKVSGKAFVSIQFEGVPYPEGRTYSHKELEIPKAQIDLPIVSEIKNSEFFDEGYLSFVIGLKERKIYRVQQLSNPARLVIDFKY
jgi:hypothetical protein